jgi:hypothetical protein
MNENTDSLMFRRPGSNLSSGIVGFLPRRTRERRVRPLLADNERRLTCSYLRADDATGRATRLEQRQLFSNLIHRPKENLVEQRKQGFHLDLVLGHHAVRLELLAIGEILGELLKEVPIGGPVDDVLGPHRVDRAAVLENVRDIAERVLVTVGRGDYHAACDVQPTTTCQRVEEHLGLDVLRPIVEMRHENVRQVTRMCNLDAEVPVEHERQHEETHDASQSVAPA